MSVACRSDLIPVRVDAFLNGKTRIVDTLLLDPLVLPLPHKGLDQNCELLAYTVLADTEVLGVSRSARHFTGRLDLYSNELFRLVTSQIKGQLQAAQKLPKKRPLPPEVNNDQSKIQKLEGSSLGEHKSTGGNKDTKGLVPIRLRLSVHGIRIHDDFDWDPNLGVSPIEFARELGDDLNLSVEAVQAVAVAITEQVHGSTIGTVEAEKDEGGPVQRSAMTAAWRLEQRVHITNVAWLVEHHKKSR